MDCDLAEEEIGVYCETDSAAEVADTECNSGDGGDELVWTGNLRNDGGGDNHSTDANGCQCDKGVDQVQVVGSRNTHSACAGRHHGREEDHQLADATFCDGDEDEADACTADDAEADRKGANADSNRVVTYTNVSMIVMGEMIVGYAYHRHCIFELARRAA